MSESKTVVLVGQTASGKSTLANYLERCGWKRVVTFTTRPCREGERNHTDYIFVSEDEFRQKINEGYFAEYTEYDADFGHVYYGTPRHILETSCERNRVIVLNPNGVTALKTAGYDIFVVYLDIDQETLMRRALARGDKPVEIGRRITADTRLFRELEAVGYVDLRITDSSLTVREIADRIQNAL